MAGRKDDAIIIIIITKIKKNINLKSQERYQNHLKYLHQQLLVNLQCLFFLFFLSQ